MEVPADGREGDIDDGGVEDDDKVRESHKR
jgi:hypothetical protein